MFKFLIGLFTLITSFLGVWGSTNSVIASVPLNQEVQSSPVTSLELPVSLNSIGSLAQVNGDSDSKNIFDHLGCSCLDCLQVQTDK